MGIGNFEYDGRIFLIALIGFHVPLKRGLRVVLIELLVANVLLFLLGELVAHRLCEGRLGQTEQRGEEKKIN